jgi:predicted ATP-grasp superfamily ATP-dependent carboligase
VTRALVTHAHSRAAVAGIRAFGAAEVRVVALADRRGAAGLVSRWASDRAVGPPSDPPGPWLECIAELAQRHGPVVVYPGQEEGAGALGRAPLPPEAIVPYPAGGAVEALRDKGQLTTLSRAAGIASPAVLVEGAAAHVAADPPDVPCVLKSPALSDALPVALMCATAGELRSALEALPDDEPVIVQERAAGRLIAVSVVIDRDGRVVARFQQEAIRLWPPDAGASSLGRSVAPDPDLIERVAHLLRSAGYWGLAQVQLLDTPRGPAAIDVNPRFYGSLPLATRAGVNLPYAWHCVALGDQPPPERPYRVGVTYRWMEGELIAAWTGDRERLRHRPPRPVAGAMWAWDDPLPGVVLAAHAAAPRLKRLTGRFSG